MPNRREGWNKWVGGWKNSKNPIDGGIGIDGGLENDPKCNKRGSRGLKLTTMI